MNRGRVLLADDHASTIRSWRALLEPEFDVVGTVSDGHALVDAVGRLHPDVIVSDIEMPGMTGISAASAILQRHPAARIILATVYADRMLVRKGLAIGAFGFVLKVRAGDELVPAVRAALRGDLHMSAFPACGRSLDKA